ncbi:MAG: hypothetical protein QOF33_4193, partial [Thermomicrobiales bacterium]|nr:hypothetical protein [Thermomicrobiales bacterium]
SELQPDRVEELQGVVRQPTVPLNREFEAAFAVHEGIRHNANGDS